MRCASMLATVLLLGLPSLSQADDAIDYAKQVKPILKERCFTCHGALRQKGGLRLDTVAFMREGGDTSAAIVPGKEAESLLIGRVATKDSTRRMPPPSEGDPLTPAQIELLREWIRSGAKGVAGEKPEADPREHWAFRKPVRPNVPAVKRQGWARNPVDAFIAREHERQGLTPAAESAKGLLLRRVYLDLIGLPPTREELHAFLADHSTDAFEKVVDRLLASPHYGERWGRHWMDVWRYSDWYGRRNVPDVWNSAPQIWRWRDWIIQSLNKDKGYDRMIQEMLAADEIAPGDEEAGVATGYIVRNWYALNPHQWMRDMVEHTGKAFLGLTFNCAHCHDHKYDPISHEEYFRFRAYFEPVDLRQDRLRGEGDPGPFQKYDYAKLRKIVELGTVRVYDEKLDAKTVMYLGGDERNLVKDRAIRPGMPAFLGGDRPKIEPVPLPLGVYYPGLRDFAIKEELARREKEVQVAMEALAKTQPAGQSITQTRVEAARAELQAYQARVRAAEAEFGNAADASRRAELARAAVKAERLAALTESKHRLLMAEQSLAQGQKRVASAQGKEKDSATAALKKLEAGLAAARTALEQADKKQAVIDAKYTPLSPLYPKISTGRRKALAEWIANDNNPLTARVAVNHIWLRHFDRALVETVFDFGRNGKRPSHGDLLDWLAVEFMESGWKMKHLHRLIVTSATYRMQSNGSDSASAVSDPDNAWYWHANPKRMEAEIVRDSILATAGALDRQVGGRVLDNVKDADAKRRSLYFSVYPEGGGHLKFLEIFDAPDPCDCYRRAGSVMPQQALALTNNALAIQHGRLLAQRLTEKRSDAEFVSAAFEHLLSRLPTESEATACREFLLAQVDLYRKANPKELAGDHAVRARASLIRVLYNHNDFITIR